MVSHKFIVKSLIGKMIKENESENIFACKYSGKQFSFNANIEPSCV